jgi:uroporphyrinogen-III synthase
VVEEVTAYRTLPDLGARAQVRQLLQSGRIDVVTFTSSSTVRNLIDALEGERELLAQAFIACIGPVTAARAAELGVRVDLVAPVHTVDGLVEALLNSFCERPARARSGEVSR